MWLIPLSCPYTQYKAARCQSAWLSTETENISKQLSLWTEVKQGLWTCASLDTCFLLTLVQTSWANKRRKGWKCEINAQIMKVQGMLSTLQSWLPNFGIFAFVALHKNCTKQAAPESSKVMHQNYLTVSAPVFIAIYWSFHTVLDRKRAKISRAAV